MEKRIEFQIAEVQLQVVAQFLLQIFLPIQPGVAYKSVAYKKACIEESFFKQQKGSHIQRWFFAGVSLNSAFEKLRKIPGNHLFLISLIFSNNLISQQTFHHAMQEFCFLAKFLFKVNQQVQNHCYREIAFSSVFCINNIYKKQTHKT